MVFVGAGASRASPSDLPDFRTLTADIAADGNVTVTDSQLAQADVLLGSLEDQHNVDVHARVAARIGVPTSEPNALHSAIAALAAAGPPIRIVTTNYDLHISTVLADHGLSVTDYIGPALPVGDDFAGLAYLHGNLSQDPRTLIVTDVDFGRAYLRDAWAARFLERMFARYTVLFIGYSHTDVVMSYLARGLGSSALRYVLTPDPESSHWKRLWINPVGYPNTDGTHDALVDALEGWSQWSSMGLLGHRERVARLVSTAPSQVPEDASYLETVVADGEKVKFFAEHARGGDWLSWAAGQPEFKLLLDPSAHVTDCSATLAYWFAEHYVLDEDHSAAALSVVTDAGGKLGPAVWSAIGHTLHRRKGDSRPHWLGPWMVLLIQNAPETTHDWLDYALVACRWPEDRALALILFDYLTEPVAVFEPSYGLGDESRLDIQLRGDDHWLRDTWGALFTPNLTEVTPEVLSIVDRHLRRAHQLLTVGGSSGPGWDPMSFSRSAIEPHEQDSPTRPFYVVVDAARDSLESLVAAGDALGHAYMRSWAASDVPLLRRLALHGWVLRDDVDATAKIEWLRRQGWLFDHQLRHEVFRLIEANLADADAATASALVDDAVAGPQDGDEHRDYETFNLLTWMAMHAPDLQSVQDALSEKRAEYPDFSEREHPDLLSWMEVGWTPDQPPMTVEALHSMIETGVDAAIDELRSYEDAVPPFDRPTWSDALGVLAKTVRHWPTDGFAILDAHGGDHVDLVRGVIRGWMGAIVDEDTAVLILGRLGTVDLGVVSDDVARLLSEGGQSESTPTEWHRLGASRDLAERVWQAMETGEPPGDHVDWLSQAINHPAGWLAQFWLHAISADWRVAGDSWPGLPDTIRAQLKSLLAGTDQRTAMAEVVIASQLHFFFAADRDWCEDHLLSLLDWANATRARRTWDGFLLWGRWNDQLLKAGLLAHYIGATEHIGEFGDQSRRQMYQHLASVGLYSEIDPIADGWLRAFTTTVDADARTEWIDQTTWLLRQMPGDAVEHQWQRWMRQYWRDRLDSVPIQLTIEEASALASWTAYLKDSMADAATLAMEHAARLGEHPILLADLSEDDRLASAPVEMTALVAHLLRETQPPFWDCHHLRDVVRKLREQSDQVDATPILEEAVRLGCSGAPSW